MKIFIKASILVFLGVMPICAQTAKAPTTQAKRTAAASSKNKSTPAPVKKTISQSTPKKENARPAVATKPTVAPEPTVVPEPVKKVVEEKKETPVSTDAAPQKTTLYPLDRIEAVIFGSETTEIITFADINRAGLDGRSRTREDIIFERLMYLDALHHRIMIDEKSIDEYIDKVKKSFNLTTDAIKKMFEEAGYTYEEGRRQFGYMQAAERMKEFKVMGRLIVPEKDVKAYYDEHPVTRPATFMVEKAFIPASVDQRAEVKKKIETKDIVFDWQRLPEVSEADLAEDKKFIANLTTGKISAPIAVPNGFEVYKLVQKKEEKSLSLEEQYRDIVDILRKPKYEKLFDEYKKNLFDSASILEF